MVMQYIKLVPGMAIMKIIYNIINAVIPTVYIILTALFIDNAVGVVLDDKAVLDAIMPLVGILLIKLFQHYSNVIFASTAFIDQITTSASTDIFFNTRAVSFVE